MQVGEGNAPNAGGTDSGSGGTFQETCVDVEPPPNSNWPDATCQNWANETPECDAEWFSEYCDLSCGRCTPNTNEGSGGAGTNEGTGGLVGEGNPWGPVTSQQTGWASRYWDCCKQSCSWSGKGGNSPVASCGSNGENEVGADATSACDQDGSATTCNSFTPWAYNNEVAFGFVATHAGAGVTCGTCYKIQFTGTSFNAGDDPGSQALNGKVMIVMATNIGGDVNANGQLDLLLPGGGTGAFYGCDETWGITDSSHPDLGANQGGIRVGCQGDLESVKTCVRNRCQTLFGSRGLDDMYDGCMWYADWFEAADNPNFRVETISCPSELTSIAN